MNKVIQDGTELFDVTVTITNGRATVTKNTGKPGPSTQSGGGPGEEQGGGGSGGGGPPP